MLGFVHAFLRSIDNHVSFGGAGPVGHIRLQAPRLKTLRRERSATMSDAPLTPCEARLGGPEGICLACPSEAVRDCILAASAPDAATDRVGTLSRLLRVLLSGEDGEAGAQAAKVCYHALQDAVADAHGSLHSALRGQDDPRSFLQTLDDAGARFGPRRPPAIVADMPSSSSSAAPGLYAVFAGQHVDYLEDLRHAYRTYHPVVGPLIEGVAAAITQQVATETVQHLASHELGLDIVAWITDTGVSCKSHALQRPLRRAFSLSPPSLPRLYNQPTGSRTSQDLSLAQRQPAHAPPSRDRLSRLLGYVGSLPGSYPFSATFCCRRPSRRRNTSSVRRSRFRASSLPRS